MAKGAPAKTTKKYTAPNAPSIPKASSKRAIPSLSLGPSLATQNKKKKKSSK